MSVAPFVPEEPTLATHAGIDLTNPVAPEVDTVLLTATDTFAVPKDPDGPHFIDLNFPDATGHLGV